MSTSCKGRHACMDPTWQDLVGRDDHNGVLPVGLRRKLPLTQEKGKLGWCRVLNASGKTAYLPFDAGHFILVFFTKQSSDADQNHAVVGSVDAGAHAPLWMASLCMASVPRPY